MGEILFENLYLVIGGVLGVTFLGVRLLSKKEEPEVVKEQVIDCPAIEPRLKKAKCTWASPAMKPKKLDIKRGKK
jgi:hypothetical protein